MKGDQKVLEYLNRALTAELTAINQFFLHAKMCDDWGLTDLGKKIREESFGEMKHAEALTERILFLEGLPNYQDLSKINVGEDVTEVLRADLELERDAHPLYREAVGYCESVEDYVSRELFDGILRDEEEHIDWLETQLELIDKVGVQNYLQSQI